MSSNPPVETLRMGALKAAIWKNTADKKTFFNVTFSRSYKVGNDWKDVDSFGRDDLLPLAKLADIAHTKILRLQGAEKAEGSR